MKCSILLQWLVPLVLLNELTLVTSLNIHNHPRWVHGAVHSSHVGIPAAIQHGPTLCQEGRMLTTRFNSYRPRYPNRLVSSLLAHDDDNDGQDESLRDDDSDKSRTKVTPTRHKQTRLDVILSRLTFAFPIFVTCFAISGVVAPSALQWVNRGNLISLMLASVMMGTGMTLEKKDFTDVLKKNFASVPAGVLCQFTIMPLAALIVGRTLLLSPLRNVEGAALFLGLALVGCSPGGTASNLVSLIAGADVALSVLLTSCSTILAAVVTPLLVKLLVGSTVHVSGMALCAATARVVLLPVILGMTLNAKAPSVARSMSRFTPFASVLLVSLICGGVVAETTTLSSSALTSATSTAMLFPRVVASVFCLHIVGFLAGFLVPKYGLQYSDKTARTISIETGMQNSALAVVLARSIGAHPLASLPGALSATTHSCLGSILAAYWRYKDSKENVVPNENDEDDANR